MLNIAWGNTKVPTHPPEGLRFTKFTLESIQMYSVEGRVEWNLRELDIMFEYHAEGGLFEGQDGVALELHQS